MARKPNPKPGYIMLKLYLGVAGSGKTGQVLSGLDRRVQSGRQAVFLVPEQFSQVAETLVYQRMGDAKSALVDVLSFRTLAELILTAGGGAALRTVTDPARAVFVRRAMADVAESLPLFARYRRDAAFCAMCAETVNELKTAGATPEKLAAVAAEQDDEKLRELAAIFAAYEEKVAGLAMDEQDRLAVAAARCDAAFFADKACYIDNFDGFTEPEYKLLEKVLAHCDDVEAALCCPGLAEGAGADGATGETETENEVFSPVRRTALRLLQLAEKTGAGSAPPVLCQSHERELAGGVFLTAAQNEWEEVRLAAAQMRRLANTGVPYSKMALVCRDVAKYESPVRRFFSQYDIPFFTDADDTIEHSAPVAFLRAALAVLRQGLSSEPVLALLKTGLLEYTESNIIAIENYVYTWRPKAADWRNGFTNSAAGLLDEEDEAGKARLQAAEAVRAGVVPALEEFIRAAKKANAAALSKRLYLLLDRVGAPQHLEARAVALEEAGDAVFAARARRAWDLAMDALGQMAFLCDDEVLDAREYDETLLVFVRASAFGTAPQALECASFSAADRMRLAAPEYCFVVGAAAGEFPMDVGYSGLLTHADREVLVAGGIEMPGSFENRVLLEEMFFYRAMTTARSGLYISWPERLGGTAMEMSPSLVPLVERLLPPALELDEAALAATPAAAFDLLGAAYRYDAPVTAALYAAVEESGGAEAARLALLDDVDNPGDFCVTDKAALGALVGERLTISPSRAEDYYKCRFAYFVDRLLKVRPLRRAEISPLESGTFVHFVLEAVLREAGAAFGGMADEELLALTARLAGEFVEQNFGKQQARAARMLQRVQNNAGELVCRLRDYSAASGFQPEALELQIGRGEGDVRPMTLQTPEGREVAVVGKVDRVDVMERDGKTYLCVIDYKTGQKAFNLRDVYCGLNMQMLLYMQTLCDNAGGRWANPVPAAVLYLPADPAPKAGDRPAEGEETPETVYRFDGIVLSDAAVAQSLLSGAAGIAIPVKTKKSGELQASRALYDLEKFGRIAARVEDMVREMAGGVYSGQFPARPQAGTQASPCGYCAYRVICRHEDGRGEAPPPPEGDPFAPPEPGEAEKAQTGAVGPGEKTIETAAVKPDEKMAGASAGGPGTNAAEAAAPESGVTADA